MAVYKESGAKVATPSFGRVIVETIDDVLDLMDMEEKVKGQTWGGLMTVYFADVVSDNRTAEAFWKDVFAKDRERHGAVRTKVRTAKCVIEKAVKRGIDLVDENGEYKAKTALDNEAKAYDNKERKARTPEQVDEDLSKSALNMVENGLKKASKIEDKVERQRIMDTIFDMVSTTV